MKKATSWIQYRPQQDVVYTDRKLSQRLVEYFKPTGRCLDPCKGDGAFFDFLPPGSHWCEIDQGRDFLAHDEYYDWIITNPPWSGKLYRQIACHAFKHGENVVLLARLHTVLGTLARHNDFRQHNHGLKEVVICPWAEAGLHSEGFVLGAFHWQRDWNNGTKWIYPDLRVHPVLE